jgi:hypothetical protein
MYFSIRQKYFCSGKYKFAHERNFLIAAAPFMALQRRSGW